MIILINTATDAEIDSFLGETDYVDDYDYRLPLLPDIRDMRIEMQCRELTDQDQALATSVDYIADQSRELAAKRLEIDGLVDRVNYDGTALAAAYNDIENLNDILIQSSRYVGQARELLAQMGIVIVTDEIGNPRLQLNRDDLIDFALALG